MLLSVDAQQVTLAHDGKSSKWKSLEKGDICQEKLERKFRKTAGISTIFSLIANVLTKSEPRKVQQVFLLQDREGRLIIQMKTSRQESREA